MRNIIIFVPLLFFGICEAQLPQENTVWQYGKGNNNMPLIFNGAWVSVKNLNHWYQDYNVKIVKSIKDTGFHCKIRFIEFKQHPLYSCIKSQTSEIRDYNGFKLLNDIPPGNYKLYLDDFSGYTTTAIITVDGSITTGINDSINYLHNYTHQIITIK